jgi:hypothetical protein
VVTDRASERHGWLCAHRDNDDEAFWAFFDHPVFEVRPHVSLC